jgi:glycogen operon protein
MDLFSYNHKENFANGENNNDGTNDNDSWDCRVPGLSWDDVLLLRKKMIKNAMSILLLSHGVPMILAGDEFGNSQNGNNNTYCQDNELSWLDWGDLEKNKDIFEYVSALIALRKSHDCLRSQDSSHGGTSNGYPRVSFHGVNPWSADYSGNMFGVMFCGDNDFVYIGINMHWEGQGFGLPLLPPGFQWSLYLASEPSPQAGAVFHNDGGIYIAPRSVVILTSIK